jgi:hypothetical protein
MLAADDKITGPQDPVATETPIHALRLRRQEASSACNEFRSELPRAALEGRWFVC